VTRAAKGELALLRGRLRRLGLRRWLARQGLAWSGLLLALSSGLAAFFLADWILEMSVAQRLVSLALLVAGVLWAARRFSAPHLARRESEIDVALLVERGQGIDSDLVAALEFESSGAGASGSASLERAVIYKVARFSRDLDLPRGAPPVACGRRLALAASSAAALAALLLLYPAHASAFLDRLLLGSRRYPTATRIEVIVINATSIVPERGAAGTGASTTLRSPYGYPLRFEVRCAGILPETARMELRALGSGLEATIELARSGGAGERRETAATSGGHGAPGEGRAVYTGELPRLLDPVMCQVFAGDDATDPARIDVIPLPLVHTVLRATPPAYAAVEEEEAMEEEVSASRQLAVIEGSRVDVRLVSPNKRLHAATLLAGGEEHALRPEDARGMSWRLEAAGTPFASIAAPLRYEARVVDADGLAPEAPIEGFISIKADRAPRVTAALVSQYVLPSAKPAVAYGVVDDYGIARLGIRHEVLRAGGGTERGEAVIFEKPAGERAERLLRDRWVLDLAPLRLAKGDQLKVTLEAIDYRGGLDGKAVASEPLVLHVTDERGVLAAMVESDERSARELDAIIERQLGIERGR
jgi:hypothetical protein